MNDISFVDEADGADMSLLAAQKCSSWLVCGGFFRGCRWFGCLSLRGVVEGVVLEHSCADDDLFFDVR